MTEVNINAKVDKKTNTAQETIIDNEIIERYSALSLGDAIKEIPGVSSINSQQHTAFFTMCCCHIPLMQSIPIVANDTYSLPCIDT